MDLYKTPLLADARGNLTPIEFNTIPFIPMRVFIVKDCSKGIRRGEHAHHKTQQYLVCLRGQIKVVIHDGKSWDNVTLNAGDATLIKNLQWDYQEFETYDDILLVICSTPFDLDDYILDFDEFLKITGNKNGNA